jgi:hypothetical protein
LPAPGPAHGNTKRAKKKKKRKRKRKKRKKRCKGRVVPPPASWATTDMRRGVRPEEKGAGGRGPA